MTNHQSPYSTSEKQKRYAEAVGPNKLFGTGDTVVRCFRMLAAQNGSAGNIQVNEVLDVLASGIVAALDDSLETPNED